MLRVELLKDDVYLKLFLYKDTMSEDVRKMIDKVKNFKEFVNENLNNSKYFLRWTSDADDDTRRNFSGNMQAWFETEKDAMDDYNERVGDGKYVPYPPRKDVTNGMWNSEPEWGLSGYGFDDEKSFNKAIEEIEDISWHHKDSLQQELVVFKSSNFILGDGFDGEDVFKDVINYYDVEPNMNYSEVMKEINKQR